MLISKKRTAFSAILLMFVQVRLSAQQVPELPSVALTADSGVSPAELLRPYRLSTLPGSINGATTESLYVELGRWPAGSTITVAFHGGDETLHRRIAVAATEWTKYGDVRFDFIDKRTGKYRMWSPADRSPSADIRVAFDGSGYWSFVGRESRDLPEPNQPTMMLQSFDIDLPSDWKFLVLHQFGHALGLWHSFQHPDVQNEFRWEDDPGYKRTRKAGGEFTQDSAGRRPGVYTLLSAPPNELDRETIDRNLRSVRERAAFVGEPDPQSVMMYGFSEAWFVRGNQSPWFRTENPAELSEGDKATIRAWYPFEAKPPTVATKIERQVSDLIEAGKNKTVVSSSRPRTPIISEGTQELPLFDPSNWHTVNCDGTPQYEAYLGEDENFAPALNMTAYMLSRNVCRIKVGDRDLFHTVLKREYDRGTGIGTGVLIAPSIILTCYHIIPDDATASYLVAEFGYEKELLKVTPNNSTNEYELGRVLYRSDRVNLDFAIVEVKLQPGATPASTKWGSAILTRIQEAQYSSCSTKLIVPQHPNGGYKQLSWRKSISHLDNSGRYLLHTADTDGGSSGAPIFDEKSRLIALHVGKGMLGPRTLDSGPRKYLNNRAVRIDKILNEIFESSEANDPRLRALGLSSN